MSAGRPNLANSLFQVHEKRTMRGNQAEIEDSEVGGRQ